MANRSAKVTQGEISRTVKGVQATGVQVERVEVDHVTGRVVVFASGSNASNLVNPCDVLLK